MPHLQLPSAYPPASPPIAPFPHCRLAILRLLDPRRGLPSSDRLDHPFLASRIRELSRRTTTVRLVASFRCAGARKGSAHRSPSFVIMKSQPGRSPPMRQVTSLGRWPPFAYSHRHHPSPHPAYDRLPGSPHCTPRMPYRSPKGNTSGRPPARRPPCRDPRVVLQLMEPNFQTGGLPEPWP